MPPASPVPGWASGEVCTESTATRRGAGRPARLDLGAGRPATLDLGAGRPATLDRGAGRPATLNRRRLRRRLSAAVLLLIGLAVAGGLAATLTPTPQVAVADESESALLR